MLKCTANILSCRADIKPVTAFWNLKAMFIWVVFTIFLEHPSMLFIPDITDPLKE